MVVVASSAGGVEAERPPTVRLEVDRETRVGTIVLERPPLNVLDLEAWHELAAAVSEAEAREDVRAIIVRGEGRALAAGADVRELAGWDEAAAAEMAEVSHAALSALAGLPMVSIAVVTGYALGGGAELALACDLRFAADNAKIGLPEVLLGTIPGAGGTQRLARLIGVGRAKELILSGRMVDMVEAPRMGLVDRVLPADDVATAASDAAAEFAAGPAALSLAKRAIDEGIDMTLDAGLALERRLFARTFATKDLRIGVESFLSNGPGAALFTGR